MALLTRNSLTGRSKMGHSQKQTKNELREA